MERTKSQDSIIKMLGMLPEKTYLNIHQISACLYFLQANKEIDDSLTFLKTANGIICSQVGDLVVSLQKNNFIKNPTTLFNRENIWELDLKGAKAYHSIKDFDKSLLSYLPDIIDTNATTIERTIQNFLYLKIGMTTSEYNKIPRNSELVCPKEFVFPKNTGFSSNPVIDEFDF